MDAPPFNEVIKHGKNGTLVPLSKIAWFNLANQVLFKMYMYRAEDLAHATGTDDESTIRDKDARKYSKEKIIGAYIGSIQSF